MASGRVPFCGAPVWLSTPKSASDRNRYYTKTNYKLAVQIQNLPDVLLSLSLRRRAPVTANDKVKFCISVFLHAGRPTSISLIFSFMDNEIVTYMFDTQYLSNHAI